MTVPYIDALLVRQSDNSFRSEAVRLPSARLGNVFRLSGERLDFREADGGVLAECGDERIVGRVELTDSLVAASEVQKAKDSVERERIISDERAGRRTLWVSIATAVISAAAAIGVALIAHIGGGGTSVAKTYKDLVECRESLNRLSTLAGNQQQTLNSLRDAVGRSIDSCSERLEAAIHGSEP
jgi:hypothetical protein